MNTYTSSELEAILYDLSEAQAANDRRRPGEPIPEEMRVKVMTAHQRLGYLAKILVAGTLLALAVFLVIRTVHVEQNHDARTPRLESQ